MNGIRSLLRSQSGQAMMEYFFAVLLAMVIILGVIQLALMFNAHSMLKLAAFNAARAAIVARGEKPEDPVTIDEMKSKAKTAAFLTILPVIPALQGRLPQSLASAPAAFQDLLGLNGSDPQSSLGVLGNRAVDVALDFLFLDVKFVKPDDEGTELATPEERLEFDDRSKLDDNVVKVLVEWKYPLVVPFINRIIFGIANPEAYALAWVAANPGLAASNPFFVAKLATGNADLPVWAIGSSLDSPTASAFLNDLIQSALLRVPMRGTYVMRMQWDRGSAEAQSGS